VGIVVVEILQLPVPEFVKTLKGEGNTPHGIVSLRSKRTLWQTSDLELGPESLGILKNRRGRRIREKKLN